MGLYDRRIAVNKRKALNIFLVMGLYYCTIFSSLSQFIVPRAKLQLFINVIVVFLFLLKNIRKNIATKPLLFDALLLAILIIVGYGYTTVHDYEYWAQYRYMLFLVFYIFAMRQKGWHEVVLKAILVAGIIYAVATMWLAVDGGTYRSVIVNLYPNTRSVLLKLYSEHKYAGITDHYSTNGMVLANAMIVAWAFMIVNRRYNTNKRNKFTIIFALILIGLFLTAKRAHLLFTAVACFTAYYICTKKERNHESKFFLMILGTLAAIVVAYLFIPQVHNVISRFFDMSEDTNIESRHVFWELALLYFSENWLFGVGWFGFRNNIAPLAHYTGHCHNVYIQLLCETGVVGFSIFIIWFVGSLIISILMAYKYFLKTRNEMIKGSLMFCLAYQLYFLMYCYSGNPLYDVYQYPLYFMACVIPMYYYKNPKEVDEQ